MMNIKTASIIKYYLSNGDLKPSEILDIQLESCCFCPTCQGFGVFNHQPKPITKVIGYE